LEEIATFMNEVDRDMLIELRDGRNTVEDVKGECKEEIKNEDSLTTSNWSKPFSINKEEMRKRSAKAKSQAQTYRSNECKKRRERNETERIQKLQEKINKKIERSHTFKKIRITSGMVSTNIYSC